MANTAESHKSVTVKKEKKSAKRKYTSSTLKQADNGGFVVTHHYTKEPSCKTGYSMPEDEENVFTEGNEMIDHLKSHFGVADAAKNESGEEESAGAEEEA